MRIHELKNPPADIRSNVGKMLSTNDNEFLQSYEYVDELDALVSKHNLKRIGNGAFGVAYEVPGKDYILKVYPETDRSYGMWIDICRQNSSIHLPRIFGKPKKIGRLLGIRMERLQQNKSSDVALVIRIMSTLYPEAIAYAGGDRNAFDNVPVETERMYADQGMYILLRREPQLNTPEMWRVAKIIYDTKKRPDVHFQNIMLRGEVPVVIDPLGTGENPFWKE